MIRRFDLVALVIGLFEGGIFVGAWGLGTIGVIITAVATIVALRRRSPRSSGFFLLGLGALPLLLCGNVVRSNAAYEPIPVPYLAATLAAAGAIALGVVLIVSHNPRRRLAR